MEAELGVEACCWRKKWLSDVAFLSRVAFYVRTKAWPMTINQVVRLM